MMKKSKTYFCIATLLVVAGLIFLAFALTHPEASFKVDIGLLYLFYAMYILLIIFLYLVRKLQVQVGHVHGRTS